MRLDETIPGGRYLVDGRWVDANGRDPEPEPALKRWPGLIAAGYTSLDAVRSASDEELLAIEGIGEATLKKLREL